MKILDRNYCMEPFHVVGLKKNKGEGYTVDLFSLNKGYGGLGMHASDELGRELQVGSDYRLWIITNGATTLGHQMIAYIYKNKVYVN